MLSNIGRGKRSRRDVLKGIGALGATAVGSSVLSGSVSAAIGDSAVYQYYHTDWSTIEDNLAAVADAGYDAIQVPPAQFSRLYEYERQANAETYDQPLGYQPIDYRDFDSVFGTEAEYESMVQTAHDQGLDVIADAVMNHMAAGGDYFDRKVTVADIPQFSSQDFHEPGDIDYNNPESVENDWLVGLRDLKQESSYVRSQLYDYLQKYASLGVDGVRFDAAKHIPESFFENYANQWAAELGLYKVGEVLDGATAVNQQYAATGMSVTDYSLYFTMREDVFHSSGDMNALEGAGLVNQRPTRAMTFVSNHDQGPPDYERLAYAYILTYEGYPRVYNHRIGVSDSEISQLLSIRRQLLSGSATTRYVDSELYVYERGNALVVLNRGDSQRSQWVSTDLGVNETLSDVTGTVSDTTVNSDGYVQVTAPAVGYAVYSATQLDDSASDGDSGTNGDDTNDTTGTTLQIEAPTADGESVYFTGSTDPLTNWGSGIEGTESNGVWEVTIDASGDFEWKTRRGPSGGSGDVWEAGDNHTSDALSPTHNGWEDGYTGDETNDTTGTTLQIEAPTGDGESVYFTGSTDSLTNWGGGVEGIKSNGVWTVTIEAPGDFEWKTRRGPSGGSGDVWEAGGSHTSDNRSPSHNGWEDGYTGDETDTSTSSGTVTDGATYIIRNASSGNALDVEYVSYEDGANVHQWAYQDGHQPHWLVESTSDGYYRLLAAHSGKALDVESASTADGANVHQWSYVGGQNQQWAFEATDGGYLLRARHSGKVLEAMGSVNGSNVEQQSEHGGDSQVWTLEEL